MNMPKYEVLRTALQQTASQLPAHSALPSERDLMASFDVSRMTVREALGRLVDEGIVYRVHGAGTFVADRDKITKSLTLTSFSEDIRSRQLEPGSRSERFERVEADAKTAGILRISPGAPVVHLERVRTADGSPMCLENVWLPADLFPPEFDLAAHPSLYGYLDGIGRSPESASQTIQATVLSSSEAALLEVAPQSPALAVSRIAVDAQERPIEIANSLYRADRYDFRLTVQRTRHR
jgi:GntR family transcriptional regulator